MATHSWKSQFFARRAGTAQWQWPFFCVSFWFASGLTLLWSTAIRRPGLAAKACAMCAGSRLLKDWSIPWLSCGRLLSRFELFCCRSLLSISLSMNVSSSPIRAPNSTRFFFESIWTNLGFVSLSSSHFLSLVAFWSTSLWEYKRISELNSPTPKCESSNDSCLATHVLEWIASGMLFHKQLRVCLFWDVACEIAYFVMLFLIKGWCPTFFQAGSQSESFQSGCPVLVLL